MRARRRRRWPARRSSLAPPRAAQPQPPALAHSPRCRTTTPRMLVSRLHRGGPRRCPRSKPMFRTLHSLRKNTRKFSGWWALRVAAAHVPMMHARQKYCVLSVACLWASCLCSCRMASLALHLVVFPSLDNVCCPQSHSASVNYFAGGSHRPLRGRHVAGHPRRTGEGLSYLIAKRLRAHALRRRAPTQVSCTTLWTGYWSRSRWWAGPVG